MENGNEKKLGALAAVLVVAMAVLWGLALLLAPAAIIKWCLLFLLG